MKKLFVIYGGPGKEKEVSVSSGKNVMEALDESGIPYEPIFIKEDFTWMYGDKNLSQNEGLELLKSNNALVFEVIHGTFGEDGVLASLLEENDISYIGSSSSAMRLTIDKFATEKVLKEHGVATTQSIVINDISQVSGLQVEFPAFVKPKDEGSSFSLYKVNNQTELQEALKKSVPEYGVMLVQPFIIGRELTCGVVEIQSEARALVPTEVILTKGDTFDYEAKYSVGGSKEVTPAEVDQETTKRIQELALKVHTVCRCKDFSRTDMILQENGELVVLEINTIPGMTKTSFIPQQLAASGYSIVDFVQGMFEKYS